MAQPRQLLCMLHSSTGLLIVTSGGQDPPEGQATCRWACSSLLLNHLAAAAPSPPGQSRPHGTRCRHGLACGTCGRQDGLDASYAVHTRAQRVPRSGHNNCSLALNITRSPGGCALLIALLPSPHSLVGARLFEQVKHRHPAARLEQASQHAQRACGGPAAGWPRWEAGMPAAAGQTV